jgi:hypothetical protein
VCVQRKREREREREKKQRKLRVFFIFFRKNELSKKKNALGQGAKGCGALVTW